MKFTFVSVFSTLLTWIPFGIIIYTHGFLLASMIVCMIWGFAVWNRGEDL